MKTIKTAIISFVFIMTGLLLLSGCTANQQDMEFYKTSFLEKANQFVTVNDNHNKNLSDVRDQADKGMKRTKVQNFIDQGKSQLELVQEDFSTSQVPAELEPLKTKILTAIDLRMKAYDDLFAYYDLKQQSNHGQEADKKLAEADKLVNELKVELEKFK